MESASKIASLFFGFAYIALGGLGLYVGPIMALFCGEDPNNTSFELTMCVVTFILIPLTFLIGGVVELVSMLISRPIRSTMQRIGLYVPWGLIVVVAVIIWLL